MLRILSLARGGTVIAIGAYFLFGATGQSRAATTLLNFEDLPAGTVVQAQYGTRGVLFPNGAFLDADAHARSGSRVLRVRSPTSEFHSGGFVIAFTSPQTSVRFYAGTTLSETPLSGTLRAFNSNGAVVAEVGPKPVTPRQFTTEFSVATRAATISRIEFKIEGTEFEAIDDLRIEGDAPANLPTSPPTVQISTPANGSQLTTSPISIEGSVSGPGLWSSATLIITSFRPPHQSNWYPYRKDLPLSGTGQTRSFSFSYTPAPLGPLIISVEAQNIAGLRGTRSVVVTNLPQAIRSRFQLDGGATAFGNFRFGLFDGDCQLAAFDQGAIALIGGDTFVVRGGIYQKWLSLWDDSVGSLLGCPKADERAAPTNSRAQDFRKGRVYTLLPTGTHYVPLAFVDAIDRQGGEAATGLPAGDPQKSPAVMSTWVFQTFNWPGTSLHKSTLEIRGSPPVLWMQRERGDLAAYNLLQLDPSNSSSAPIWQSFPCTGNEGPCDVPPTSPSQLPHPPIPNVAEQFCDGGPQYPLTPWYWKAIKGDYVLTPLLGIVKESRMAAYDLPLVHETPIDLDVGVIDVLTGTAGWAAGTSLVAGVDWNIHVHPLEHKGVAPYPSLFAANTQTVEIEFEYMFARAFLEGVAFDKPRPGDLLFTSGRWVIDCAHAPFNSEIHPPSVLAFMRTSTHNGKRATEANIWVNGYYPGDPVEFEIWPPPRPSPTATLSVFKPDEADPNVAFGLNLQTSFGSNGDHVKLRFDAPVRHVEIGYANLMKWATGRVYQGKWFLYWSE